MSWTTATRSGGGALAHAALHGAGDLVAMQAEMDKLCNLVMWHAIWTDSAGVVREVEYLAPTRFLAAEKVFCRAYPGAVHWVIG